MRQCRPRQRGVSERRRRPILRRRHFQPAPEHSSSSIRHPALARSLPTPMPSSTPVGLTLWVTQAETSCAIPATGTSTWLSSSTSKLLRAWRFEFRAEAFNIFNHVEYGPLAATRAAPLEVPDSLPGPAPLSPDQTSCRSARLTVREFSNSVRSLSSDGGDKDGKWPPYGGHFFGAIHRSTR